VKPNYDQIPVKLTAAHYYAIAVTFCAFAVSFTAQAQAATFPEQAAKPANPVDKPASRDSYRIEVDLDYHNASFIGREIIRYTNRTREDLDFLSFCLYPNFGLLEDDEPSLTVQKVTVGGKELNFSSRSRNAQIRVDLPQKLRPGQGIELKLDFMARIPRVQREETSLLAHFLEEVSDALNDERQPKDARDIFFAGEEAMLLGYFFPMVAPRQQQQSLDQNLAVSVGALVNGEVADYDVMISSDEGLTLISSADSVESKTLTPGGEASTRRKSQTFHGEKLRGFAVAIFERMKSVEQKVGAARVISYFRETDERVGKRALNFAANSIRVYEEAYGEYPYGLLQVVEAPLAAGYSNIHFPGMVVIAQAYYVDFDAPQAARLPGVLREQADLIRSSFEFTIAYGVAKQWWGESVGSDSERAPYLDEALANFSAAYYHESTYGKKLGDLIIDQQLRGAYEGYRMLGGADAEVDKPVRDFRNSIQYTAIVQAKGALLFVALRKELGDDRFFAALRQYYSKNSARIATPERLRLAITGASENPRAAQALFQRWLKERHGDEDIGTPDMTLVPPRVSKIRALGRVFVKIGKTASKPF
jgi:aminopeptidase N